MIYRCEFWGKFDGKAKVLRNSYLKYLSMISTIFLIALNLAILNSGNAAEINIPTMNRTAYCYSEENFEIVYKFIEDQIQKGEKEFYSFQGYQLFIIGGEMITIKQSDWSQSVIHKEKGIYSLAKSLKSNQKHVEKASAIFCKILDLQEKANWVLCWRRTNLKMSQRWILVDR